ncbi:MAG: hypothetical protein ACLSDQ_14210, partial [Adlercreutzia equolifaciens]
MKCIPSATSDLPEPVGVPSITWSPTMRSMRASSWWGQSSMPRTATHSRNRSSASSGASHGSGSASSSSGSHHVGANR